MKIYETDQWTASSVIDQKLTEESVKEDNEVFGGGADAARAIFNGGKVKERDVPETATPTIGYVWFKVDEKGFLHIYKTNYDSSD